MTMLSFKNVINIALEDSWLFGLCPGKWENQRWYTDICVALFVYATVTDK